MKLFLIKNEWMDPMELDEPEEEVFNQDLMTRIMLDIPEVGLRIWNQDWIREGEVLFHQKVQAWQDALVGQGIFAYI